MSDFPFFNRNISIKVMQNEFFLVMSVFLKRTFFKYNSDMAEGSGSGKIIWIRTDSAPNYCLHHK